MPKPRNLLIVAVDIDGTGRYTVHQSIHERTEDGSKVEKVHRTEFEVESVPEDSENWLKDVLLAILDCQ